ncbi:MAG: glycosyltransferase family 4 protein [Phycisphaerales bacterium]
MDRNETILGALLVASAVASFIATWFMVRHGRAHFLDVPNERSSHATPTPRGGGIAFVAVFFVAAIFYGLFVKTDLRADCRWIPVAVFPLVLVGVVDDLRGLSAKYRFVAQMLTACLIIILLGKPLPTFIGQFGIPTTALLLFAVTIPIAAAINFSNFMDGLDGLVAGMSFVQLAFIGWYLDVSPAWLILAALAGFLVWNWPKAKIFMGDTGSTFLGAAPVMLGILSNADPLHVVSAWTVTTPLHLDAFVTLVRRALRRENLLEGHREHLYQRLHRAGWTHARVTLTYVTLTAACAALIGLGGVFGALGAVALSVICYVAGELWLSRSVSSSRA